MSAQDEAKKLVNAFAARKTGGNLWKSVTRAGLAAGLLDRIDDPTKISQAEANLCGPESFLFIMATNDPVTYARASIELWESGRTIIDKLQIKPSSDLMNYRLPASVTINPADWVLPASLRDSSNFLLDFQSIDGTLSAMTTADDMEEWFKKAGYTHVINHTNPISDVGRQNAKAASDLYAKNYKVSLYVNDNMLYLDKQNKNSWTANHWIVLRSGIAFTDTLVEMTDPQGKTKKVSQTADVSLEVYTWGGLQRVPQAGSLALSSFLDNYYGFVAAKY